VASDYSRGKRVYFRILVAQSDRPGGAYLLGADSEEIMNSWLEAISDAWGKYKSESEGISNVSLSSDSVGPSIQPKTAPANVAAGEESAEAEEASSASSSSAAEPKAAPTTPAKKLSMEEAKKRRHSTQSHSRLNRVISHKTFGKVSKEEAPEAVEEDGTGSDEVLDEVQKAQALYSAVVSGNRGAAVAWMQLGVDVNWANEEQGGRTALHMAMYRGDLLTVEELLKNGADPGTPDAQGMTPLHLAAHHGHKTCLDLVVDGDKELIDRLDNADRTPIYMALTAGHTSIAEHLIKIAIEEEIGKWRKYHLLAIGGQQAELETLLADDNDDTNPLKPIAPADCDVTPVHLAAAGGHFDTLAFLLSKARGGANCITVLDQFKRTPLHFAVACGDPSFITRLVKIGASVDIQDSYGKTALHFAAGLGQHEVAKELLAEHSAKYLADSTMFTPLHVACVHGRAEVAELLLSKKVANANEVGAGSLSPLFLAAHNGHSSCIEVLLRYDVDVNLQTDGGLTALHEAARRQNRSCLQLLLASQSNKEVTDGNGETPLFAATRSDSVECVSTLIDAGASFDVKNKAGESLLTIAAASGDVELVATFLDQGMDPSEEAAGVTPLSVAATAGLKYVTKVLLSSGADPSSVDADGNTAMHHAVSGGHADVLCELIDFNAHIRCQNKANLAPLHLAAAGDRLECLEVLLANGAPPNVKDSNGATPMHLAAARGSVQCVQRLLLFGGKVHAKNSSGLTPVNEAASHRKLKCTLLLVAHGATVDKDTTELLKSAMKSLAKAKKKKGTSSGKKTKKRKVPHSVAVPMRPLVINDDDDDASKDLDLPELEATSEPAAAEEPPTEEPSAEHPTDDVAEPAAAAEEPASTMAEDAEKSVEEESAEVAVEAPEEEPSEQAAEERSVREQEQPAEEPAPAAVERPAEEPAAPAEESAAPAEESAEEPAAEPVTEAKEPAAEPVAVPAEEPAAEPKEEPVGAPTTEAADSADAAQQEKPKAPKLSEQELARQYIGTAQKLLSKADYKAFHLLLREYKAKSLSVEDLFERLCALFATEETKTLLEGFVTFVPPSAQAQYSKLVSERASS